MAEAGRDILVVATADWDNPFWTNKQHVAVELVRAGRRVFYVESAGLRRPSVREADRARIARRLGRALRPPREVRADLWVWSPLTVPLQGRSVVRALNRGLLRAGLSGALRHAGMAPQTLWTYSPLTPAFYDLEAFSRVLYHAVDDIAAQPGMPEAVIRASETELVRRADLVFTTSPALQARHAAAGARRCVFSPNVADADHFAQALDPAMVLPPELAAIPEPRVGFIGAISGYKVDLALIGSLARLRPNYSLVLIGAVGEGEPWSDVGDLRGLPNVHLLGPRPYARLPAYMAGLRAGLLPCPANPYTTAMFPMKFFEYLAAGLPVVSTRLPALADVEHLAITASDGPQGFAAAVDRALAGDGAPPGVRLEAARSQTYARRTAQMLAELDALAPQ